MKLTRSNRHGAASPVVVVLLVGILLALLGLIVVTLAGRSSQQATDQNVATGTTISREDFSSPPPKVKPVGNPDRVREVLQQGKTYRAVIKGGFDARVEDKDWGLKQVTNLAYEAEMQVTRKIESNDGHRIIELRTFDKSRNAKVLSQVEGVSFDLGPPGILLLGALEYLQPGSTETVAVSKPLIEGFLTGAAQAVADDTASKALVHVDSLSGKSVRIVFVDDGLGVESIMPVDCNLTQTETDFVKDTAVLSDCYILPDVKIKPGESWKVEGSQFIGFFDPTLRGVPTGSVIVKRSRNEDRNGKQFALLSIDEGHIDLDASDSAKRRIGSFTPRGSMDYNITDGYTQAAQLKGDMQIEEVSKDHILFESTFRTQPRLVIQYSCQIVP